MPSQAQPVDLPSALEAVRAALVAHAQLGPDEAGAAATEASVDEAPRESAATHEEPSRLQVLCDLFNLDAFERDVLVLCAGIELDASFAPLCAKAQVDPQRAYPTFGLALAALPDAHWQALLPEAPLRFWRLLKTTTNDGLTGGQLRIDERILHYLMGLDSREARLAGLVEPVTATDMVPSHQRIAVRIAQTWQGTRGTSDFPVVELCGGDAMTHRSVAAAAASLIGMGLEAMAAESLPTDTDDLDHLLRLWQREALLTGTVLLLEGDELTPGDPRHSIFQRFVDRCHSALIVAHRKRMSPRRRPVLSVDVDKPRRDEQRVLWQQAMGNEDARIATLVGQFHLSAAEIRGAWFEALGRLDGAAAANPGDVADALWQTCRERVRPALDGLADRIPQRASWDDLVLPEAQIRILRDIVVHMQQRATVYREWGFGGQSARGHGMSALFAGASGTGKTMAAEVLAEALDLDLYRIDLSSVINKYIGETEKNLQRLFDAAEAGGAILLFDEADALFGKRSEVKDSHDRYANIEVSYLLQRVETYRGLAILTTNLLPAIDVAFKRRLRFIVEFPFPGPAERRRMWERAFPAETPTQGLDPERLARVNLSGGNIRNIAVAAAFLAAEEARPITMRDLLIATQRELAKLNRPLAEAETRDWLS